MSVIGWAYVAYSTFILAFAVDYTYHDHDQHAVSNFLRSGHFHDRRHTEE